MFVTHMSPSWTWICVQIRFYRVHAMYIRVPIGNLVVVRLYVVLLDNIGDPPPMNPCQGPGLDLGHPQGVPHVGNAPQGMTHAWANPSSTWTRIALL